jgi:hypothetical protein
MLLVALDCAGVRADRVKECRNDAQCAPSEECGSWYICQPRQPKELPTPVWRQRLTAGVTFLALGSFATILGGGGIGAAVGLANQHAPLDVQGRASYDAGLGAGIGVLLVGVLLDIGGVALVCVGARESPKQSKPSAHLSHGGLTLTF